MPHPEMVVGTARSSTEFIYYEGEAMCIYSWNGLTNCTSMLYEPPGHEAVESLVAFPSERTFFKYSYEEDGINLWNLIDDNYPRQIIGSIPFSDHLEIMWENVVVSLERGYPTQHLCLYDLRQLTKRAAIITKTRSAYAKFVRVTPASWCYETLASLPNR